ncbi:glycosyl transferase family 1 [Syntrophotalea acetylenivorans]|uniref:Glycosyl transferase family 1 n=1 Tax=Syntrophotalea acetylenivorans TaxID=1842532 RepID=A0A1L3GPX3_9BACT|nr:glycosyltransferase [Syntrophotalea acetylenivorans]APG27996.1 glycosyl transferase family 1 [Syntrophotalea acetylenivorans]
MSASNKNDSGLLDRYAEVTGREVIHHLQQLAAPLKGAKVVHVNSTREGGGVAEILQKLIPLKRALGIDASWEVINGSPDFYECTKGFHNGLQGMGSPIPKKLLAEYEKINAANAENLRGTLEEADFVVIHDPQPAPLLSHCPARRGRWLWRCHIDASHPYRPVWKYLRQWVIPYDASIFSIPQFAQPLPHPQYIVAPSIDPLSEKNRDLPLAELQTVRERFNLDPALPLMLQVSRYDRFKDPLGVVQACQLAGKLTPLQLVLAGGGASDDPEGEAVLEEVRQAAADDPRIQVLLLPADAHHTINALQRTADIVLQKSIREGFGLTVAEAMWKGKPVIGGDTGGIRLQVFNHYTGFLVRTPEGAALRIRYLLHRRELLKEMGQRAQRFVGENFLITRHLREYLTMLLGLQNGTQGRMELGL